MDCSISFEAIADYVDGKLSASDAAEVGRHLRTGCPSCQDCLDWLITTMPLMADAFREPEQEKPPLMTGATLALVSHINRLLPAAPDRKHYFAELISAPRPVPVVRGAVEPAVGRVYETPQHRVLLWDEPDDGAKRYVIGQVYARSGEAVQTEAVRLLDGTGTVLLAEREGSEFHLPAVTPGSCLISCELGGECIILPRVEVGRA